jgi:probable addiction module antidote protein
MTSKRRERIAGVEHHAAPFDTARHLDNPEVIAHYLAEAFESGDNRLILRAIGNVIRARRVAQVARETGMSRTREARAAVTPRMQICSICQREFSEFGNSADPVNDGRCCDRCDSEVVIPARMRRMKRDRML